MLIRLQMLGFSKVAKQSVHLKVATVSWKD